MVEHIRLGVNVDHVATLRNARGGMHPDPVEAGKWYLLARAGGLDDEWLRAFFAGLSEDQQAAATEAAARLGG